MDTTSQQNIFHPYKLISQSKSTLQLQPGAGPKVGQFIFRFMPLVMIVTGIILYLSQKQPLFLAVFCGIGLLEAFLFSFIKIPGALSLDSMGFTLQLLSIKGQTEIYYLWSDVDFIRYRVVRAKNSTTLGYEAILLTGKKRSILNFANYFSKKQQIPEINAVLHDISRKEVREK